MTLTCTNRILLPKLSLSRTIEACIADVEVWLVQNKLHLNDGKIEILLLGFALGIDFPSSVHEG